MPRQGLNLDDVRKLMRKLPEVEESTTYGAPAWKVRGKLMACVAVHRSAETDSLAVKVDATARESLLAEYAEWCYLTPHYQTSSLVLVRLALIDRGALESLLKLSREFLESQPTRRQK